MALSVRAYFLPALLFWLPFEGHGKLRNCNIINLKFGVDVRFADAFCMSVHRNYTGSERYGCKGKREQ